MAKQNTFDREKAIELAMGSIEKQFGKGSIMRLGENEQILRVDGLVIEYKYVGVHRRILDMEEKGINCIKLKDHLDIVTLLVEDREPGAISFEARIE